MEESNFLKTILNSAFFKKSYENASEKVKSNRMMNALLGTVFNKMESKNSNTSFGKITSKLASMLSLVKHYINGSYRDVETKSIVLVTAGLIYFLSPIDLIPDFLPLIGYADDIALLTYIFTSLSGEIEKFELWKLNRNADIDQTEAEAEEEENKVKGSDNLN